jgi:hypothetical protein
MSEPVSMPKQAKEEREVTCAKCEHVNPPGARRCVRCGEHLFISCHRCGEKNERFRTRCASCGQRLHRSVWRRWRKKLFPERMKIKPFEIVLLIVAVIVTYKVIIKLAEM